MSITAFFGPIARTPAVTKEVFMSEPIRSLPSRPSLDQQKKLAKELLADFRANDAEAISRIRHHLPDKQSVTLSDAQLTLAREYGFTNWTALKDHIERVTQSVPRPVRQELHEAFERRDWSSVRTMFAQHPSLRAEID